MLGNLLPGVSALALALAPATFLPPPESDPLDLVTLAERYCIGPDGDHELTWALAVRDGYSPLSPEEFEGLRLPGARQLRGFTQTINGSEIRVLTAVNRWIGGGQGYTPFHLCWVSANPADRRVIDQELGAHLGVGRFRQEGALVFAWIPQEDSARRTVRRREFQRRGMAIAREDGMRMALTNQYGSMVAITYMTPVETCADWCY